MAQVVIFNDMTTLAWSRSNGPYRLATELRKRGYTVQVVEFFWFNAAVEPRRNLEAIERFVGPETLVVGFSTTFVRLDSVHSILGKLNLLQRFNEHPADGTVFATDAQSAYLSREALAEYREAIKRRAPRAKLVVGGTRAPATLGEDSLLDVTVHGYADQSFIQLVLYLDGKNPFFQFKSLPGGKLIVNDDVKASGFDVNNAIVRWEEQDCLMEGEQLVIEISRGCIFRCKFCSFPLNGKSKNDFIKSFDTLDWELRRNYDKYGISRYFFSDDTYNDSPEKVAFMHSLLTSLPFQVKFRAYLRQDLIHAHRQEADQLLESGLETAFFGIESLNYDNLKAIGKGMRPDKVVDNLNWLRHEKGWKGNATVLTHFIVGLPFDSPDNLGWMQQVEAASFPTDHTKFMGLNITPWLTVSDYMSEFDKNYEAHGYTFPRYEQDNNYWVNKNTGLDYYTAWRLAREANDRMFYQRRDLHQTAYHTHNMALALPLSAEDTVDDFHSKLMTQRLQVAQEYHSRLINL